MSVRVAIGFDQQSAEAYCLDRKGWFYHAPRRWIVPDAGDPIPVLRGRDDEIAALPDKIESVVRGPLAIESGFWAALQDRKKS